MLKRREMSAPALKIWKRKPLHAEKKETDPTENYFKPA